MRAVACRVGCTEGQLYTLACGLVIAAMLTLSTIPNPIFARPAEAASTTATSAPLPSAATGPIPTTSGTPTPAGPVGAVDPSPPASDPPVPTTTNTTSPPGGGTPPAPPPPCSAQPALDGASQVLANLESATGLVPEEATQRALAGLLGCSEGDPALQTLALLVAVANRLPEPPVQVPGVPLGELPAPVIAAVQPLRPVLDQMCAGASTAAAVVILAIGAYPPWMASPAINTLLPILELCGQIQR